MRRQYGLPLLLVAMLLLSGCAAVIAGTAAVAGTWAYMDGWLKRDYYASVENTLEASALACEDMGYRVTDRSFEPDEAEVRAENDEERVWVDIDWIAPGTVTVAIRVGWLGDKEASRQIHKKIEERL
ncbi:DUF3568 family protein [Desulfohalovibrio reitneri]|uniref:DUF3568 family protein n=1 Tax=Desulfohalovibrio reitneri TaxID=1307759 RepID=UPI0004A713CF|nr:DUF3568 family protein [Desulfohalovibrio reitneri]